jgi:hypothetical protein
LISPADSWVSLQLHAAWSAPLPARWGISSLNAVLRFRKSAL